MVQALCYATMVLALWRQEDLVSTNKEIPPFKISRFSKITNDTVFSHRQAVYVVSFTFHNNS